MIRANMLEQSLWFLMPAVLLLASAIAEYPNGPDIKGFENEVILQYGQNYSLVCASRANPVKFKQQDLPEVNNGIFYMDQIEGKDDEEFWVQLNLYNVDQFAVGYYACYEDIINSTEILSNLVEEPNNTEHVTYIYIYVNGPTLFAPVRTFVIAKSDSKFLVECKPTTPNIKVKLMLDFADVEYDSYDPKLGFKCDSNVLSNTLANIFICFYKGKGLNETKEVLVHKHIRTEAPKPTIYGGEPFFLEGESFSINCTVNVQRNVPVDLSWIVPGALYKVTNVSNAYTMSETNPVLYKNISVSGATKEDQGNYTCVSSSNHEKKNYSTFQKIFLQNPVLEIRKRGNDPDIKRKRTRLTQMMIYIDRAYPPAKIYVVRNNVTLPNDGIKYEMYQDPHSFTFKIRQLEARDTGIYNIQATNGYVDKSVSYFVQVRDKPKVDFRINRKYLINSQASMICEVEGYPLPSIQWVFTDENGLRTVIDKKHQEDVNTTLYKIQSTLTLKVRISGTLSCNAVNDEGNDTATRSFLVHEMPNGFGIVNADDMWFAEGDNVTLRCLASKYDFVNVSWYDENYQEFSNVMKRMNDFSLVAELKLDPIKIEQAGLYTCIGLRNDGSEDSQSVNVTVAEIELPTIMGPETESQDVELYKRVNMSCVANAIPPPTIQWFKDDTPLEFDDKIQEETTTINRTALNSTVTIFPMQEDYAGTYECRINSQGDMRVKSYSLVLQEAIPHKSTYLYAVGVIFFVLIIVLIYLTWKIRKEKQFRKELAAAGLLYFKKGVTKSINPDLGIDEQAELLPYDDRFEFPPEKLSFGKQLGAGAFGVVYKAEARGIINAEETTTVAVKMVKKTADNMYIKALASELKIMVHLGKHINIVNLLGACTKNVGKRELIVIVEYCKYGNIHNYLQKHREVFIDQLTDNSEKNQGKVNRGFSCSSGNSGMHSDYFGSNHTQETDNTFLNTANTNRSGRKDNQNYKKETQNKQVEFSKVSESGYLQPDWRSNYESDYSFDGRNCRPLCSRDLLAWAFQIARGMEYLASRKVLHGDLAARNILLAEDNVVKICDFGLARSIYKNDEYHKKENSPLPVKWLAIECMTDRIFSTQSDVWSFGIVLWELFSLAKTPYPNVSPTSLLQWLTEGRRLEKPPYADDRLYEVMKKCWASKPTARPSFTQLQETLGSFLEDNVRNHYVDLNATYMDMNVKQAREEDYLAMVSAPDYNNLVTPSPHHYVNDKSFFPPTPTQLQHDDEGYLQMSPASRQNIFNARPQGTKFDFDARKLTPRASEANSYGSESTPMLTLNNLPRSGSESDQEGNTSPYMNMCPKIEEETDDVFGTKENIANNIPLNEVTNLTYITLSVEDEKKPQNFANSYVNVNVPNGLVK